MMSYHSASLDTLLYLTARALLACVQALPMRWVVMLGRGCGAVAFRLDARHRRVARRNLAAAFPEQSSAGIDALARENFRRIGENWACAIKTAGLPAGEITRLLEVVGGGKLPPHDGHARASCIVAVGHFGNFELVPRASLFTPGYQYATTYRGLRNPGLNRLLQMLREMSGCLYFDRRTGAAALKALMAGPGVLLGLYADQHAGDRGLRLPLLGRDCSTSAAPAIFALRYGCPLYTAICYRIEPGRWRIEVGDEIPTHAGGEPRAVEAISLDVNRALDAAIRRDPANWFWVHNRWKEGRWR